MLEGAGLRGVRMVITESGLGDGWRGRARTTPAMAADFAWFTDELQKRRLGHHSGHASFGLFGNDDRWRAFDLRRGGTSSCAWGCTLAVPRPREGRLDPPRGAPP